ncbi:unnamed protein product [Rotaria sp. Silwood1]|nr:unnamed protein product [Rotaria sp. Silwood1]
MNSTFEHAQSSISSKTIYIFWSHTQSEIYARRNNAGNWSPNHFVPLLLPSNESQYQNSMTEPKATGSGLTPTKSTTKNNILTQVRIPEFNAEDDETQQFQMSSTLSTVNQEIATTPRTKRRLQVTENYTNVENTNMDRRRQKARESMAAKRAQATPEEAGRQRTLARERSAARRATITPEQAERERTLARERSAARRAALTPEQTERERSLDRQRKAARRAAITPEQTERERSLDRQRKAARRAALTPDEIVQQRAITREKTEAWRATFSSKEIEYQRVLAAENSMSKRATASPKEAEEQRVVARKRSAARRAAYTFDELERQRASARQRKQLRKSGKHQHETMKTKVQESNDFEWPKPIDIEHKKNCLKNFIQHMSMSFLEEGVCGICNIRCYKRDLRHMPFRNVPIPVT